MSTHNNNTLKNRAKRITFDFYCSNLFFLFFSFDFSNVLVVVVVVVMEQFIFGVLASLLKLIGSYNRPYRRRTPSNSDRIFDFFVVVPNNNKR